MNYKEEILARIKPNEDEVAKYTAIVEKTLKTIQDSLDSNEIKAEVRLGGSFAKNTWLKGDFDCDVFIRFDKSYEDSKLSNMVEKNLPFDKIQRVHGSRDYFQFLHKGINFEIVPCYFELDVENAVNSTDISALHIDWVQKKEKDNANLCDEIRVTKQFFKAQNIYGAESYLFGFSGHVIDILVAHYGSFETLLESALKWDEKEVVDPENVYKGKDALQELNKSKTDSPLIVIDPILPSRNASAALRINNFNKLKKKAKLFLDTKDISMFDIPVFNPDNIKVCDDEILLLAKLEHKKGSKDIVGCKVLKLWDHIRRHIINNEFNLVDTNWTFKYNGDSYIYYVVKNETLSDMYVRMGPPLKAGAHADKFKEKNNDVFEKDGRLYANVKRKYTKVKMLIKDLLKSDYAHERVNSYELIF